MNMRNYSHDRGRNSWIADGMCLTVMFGFTCDVLKE